MREFTRYDKKTGRIICIVSCTEDQPVQRDTESVGFIDGHYKSADFYISAGVPIAKPERPGNEFDWDYLSAKWVLNASKLAELQAAQQSAAKIAADAAKIAENLLWLDNFIKKNGVK